MYVQFTSCVYWVRTAEFLKPVIFMNRFQVKKQPLEGVLEKKPSFVLGDIDIFIKVLVLYEQLKTQSIVFCRSSIIIFKEHANPQACKVIFPPSINETRTIGERCIQNPVEYLR